MRFKSRYTTLLILPFVFQFTSCSDETLETSEEALIGNPLQMMPPVNGLAEAQALCNNDPRVQQGLVSPEVCAGAHLFFRDPFDGNGRSCASCHAVQNNFTIDVPFIASLPASDPLFIAEQDPALATLERSDLLRDFGLIVENVDGTDDLDNKFTMRSVPHTLSMATSIAPAGINPQTGLLFDGTTLPPNERTGWSGDGAPNNGELRDFQTGAVFQHYPRDLSRTPGVSFREPTDAELDVILAYQLSLGRTNELDLSQIALTDPDAQAGIGVFLNQGACNGCHLNAGANAPVASGGNFNFDTGVELIRIPEVDAQNIPLDGGFGGQGLSAPNFDTDGDGINDSFGNGGFNTPPLVEAADTGPFFHTNAFDTIESAVAFYNTPEFNNSPAGQAVVAALGSPVALSNAEVEQVGRFLRVINASFNLQMAVQRIDAIEHMGASAPGAPFIPIGLIQLTMAETEDALEVLASAPGNALHSQAQTDLTQALQNLQAARRTLNPNRIRNLIGQAREQIQSADQSFGTNVDYVLGQGNLMF